MVRVSPKPGFFAGKLFEMTLCRWCAALLQALAQGMMPLTVVLDSLTAEYLSLAISSQVDDAEIDTKRSISGSRGRLWNLKRHSQVELPFAVEKGSLPFDTFHACLLIATNQKWNKYPTRERHKGNGIKALKGHDTLVAAAGTVGSCLCGMPTAGSATLPGGPAIAPWRRIPGGSLR